MSATTLHPIEIFYNDIGTLYPSAKTQRGIPRNILEYARFRNVSSDGCQTTKDIDYRSGMLKGIARGHENGWLKR